MLATCVLKPNIDEHRVLFSNSLSPSAVRRRPRAQFWSKRPRILHNHCYSRRLWPLHSVREQSPVVRDSSRRLHPNGPVVVLFKHDLRLDDHPGLHLAMKYECPVIPLYCLDNRLVYPYCKTSGQIELLWGALHCLKVSLQSLGNDLVLRIGELASTLREVIAETQASVVIIESEPDIHWRKELELFRSSLPDITIREWQCRMYPAASYSQNYRRMDNIQTLLQPLQQPTSLTPLYDDVNAGQLPNLDDFRRNILGEVKGTLRSDKNQMKAVGKDDVWIQKRWSEELTSDATAPLRLLRNYLSPSQAEGPIDSIMETLRARTEDQSFPGISFAALFSETLALGLLSPRRVRHEVEQLKSPWNFFQKSLPFQTVARSTSESYDFHGYIAEEILRHGCEYAPGNSTKEFWRWKGILAEYSVSHPQSPSRGSVVLVHGFGASCMHWRRNVDALAAAGYTVYCPSLPGYGRTQKLYKIYSQLDWIEFLTDFIEEIAQETVVLGGNSIGAFAAAQTAAHCPDRVSALILINPAGPIDPNYIPSKSQSAVFGNPPPAFVVDICANLLLFYLELSAGRILRSVYPVNIDNADEAFLNELLRAARDPNAIAVLKSVFFLKKPIPLNVLLTDMFCKPVLLLQGALDPLNDARTKGNRINDLCSNVEMKMLQAGHCSHDEVPDLVNEHLIQFLTTLTSQTAPAVLV